MFRLGEYKSRSGRMLPYKVECNDLTYEDMIAIADHIKRNYEFGAIYAMSENMIPITKMLKEHMSCHRTILVLDDVLTTGETFKTFKNTYKGKFDIIGVVIFARGKCPSWVKPIWREE